MDIDPVIRHNHSIVIARTREGTLLRKIEALEILTIKEEMPIGAYAWQQEMEEMVDGVLQNILKWRHTVDQGRMTFRHYEFALPVKLHPRGEGYEFGSLGSGDHFPLIGSLIESPDRGIFYIVPRELVPEVDLVLFDENILWFIARNQNPEDSVEYRPQTRLKNYVEFLPQRAAGKFLTTSYALCSHRPRMLTTWNGSVPIEKGKILDIGKWYTCQYSPKHVNKCTSIHPFDGQPVPTYTQTFIEDGVKRTLTLCHDIVKLPVLRKHPIKSNIHITSHPLLDKILFPTYCAFLQEEAVDVCFARESHASYYDGQWWVVAVRNRHEKILDGYEHFYWLPDLPPPLDQLIRREEFPFIKSLTAVEADHYAYLGSLNFDQVNVERVNHFKKYHNQLNGQEQYREESFEDQEQGAEEVYEVVGSNVVAAAKEIIKGNQNPNVVEFC